MAGPTWPKERGIGAQGGGGGGGGGALCPHNVSLQFKDSGAGNHLSGHSRSPSVIQKHSNSSLVDRQYWVKP